MKKLVERFALWLLRKTGHKLGGGIGSKILFHGRWWTAASWSMRYISACDTVELNITALSDDEGGQK